MPVIMIIATTWISILVDLIVITAVVRVGTPTKPGESSGAPPAQVAGYDNPAQLLEWFQNMVGSLE